MEDADGNRPTLATGLFIINLLEQTSLFRHCAPGFAFVRFSPDDANQSWLAANYAHGQLHVRRAAIFYDPGNPSSVGSAGGFSSNFTIFDLRVAAHQRRDYAGAGHHAIATGVSSPIRLHEIAGILVTSTQVAPVILGVQDDGSLQIVG